MLRAYERFNGTRICSKDTVVTQAPSTRGARDPLAWLGRHAAAALPAGLALGLVVPDLAALARPLLAPALVAMMALSMIRLDLGRVAAEARRPWLIVGTLAWLMVGSPLAAAGIGTGAGLSGAALAAVVLSSAAPPILASLAFALMLGLRAELTLVVVMLATVACPLTLPPLVGWLVGLELAVGVADLMGRLALLIGLATLIGRGSRAALGPDRVARLADHLDGLLVIALTVFAVSIMDGVTARLFAEPARFAWLTALVLMVSLLHQAAPLLAWRWVDRPTLVTVAMISGYRNMGIIIAALGEAVDPDIFLFFVVAQVPIYCLPVILKPVYRRLGKTAGPTANVP